MITKLKLAVFRMVVCTKCGNTSGNPSPNATPCKMGGYCVWVKK